MNGLTQHSLCDALCGLAEQSQDIFTTIGALLELLGSVRRAFPDHDGLAADHDRLLQEYAVVLSNAEARAEGLRKSLLAVAAVRADLESKYAALARARNGAG